MASRKITYWLTEDGLTLISGWARDGLTDEQIAKNIGISRSTLNEWKKKYSDISDTLKKNKEIVDYEVENSLLKRCFGYNIPVKKNLKVKRTEYKEGFKIKEYEEIVEVFDEVHIPADTTAQIFWLKNRQSQKWRDKPEENSNSEEDKVVIVNDLPK
ncbi:MAG: transposase [Clostridia bacterium]